MSPATTAADLLPTDVYALVRPEYRGRIIELKRRRRVSIGPHVSLVFESRATVLYQIQEILWAERTSSPARIAEEIAEYERLIPRAGEITATLMIQGGPPQAGRALMEDLVAGKTAVFLKLGEQTIAAEALSPLCDVSCPVQYLRFALDREAAAGLVEGHSQARIGVAHAGEIDIVPLPRATLDELASDLQPSRAPAVRPAAMLSRPANPQ